MTDAGSFADYMKDLNAAQSKAVQHPPHIPLQILAGPGSGKTKVLTSRIAHLIVVHAIPPASICAVTFTNKAANEMRERLEKLVGKQVTGRIKMGTFHALCAMFLRKHANLIGIGTNFTVCDADESKRIVTKLLKPHSDYLDERNVVLKEAAILSRISKAKAKGLTPNDLAHTHTKSKSAALTQNRMDSLQPSQVIANVVTDVYEQYQSNLKQSNSLDFDDLLVYGVKLFRDHPEVNKWCQHVLVDEFQDTNTVQYQLMTHIAGATRCVSVVGDPDQSIYGWRSAEAENLAHMQRDFPSTRQIFLEQNYRSTGAILATSVAIISQDESRIAKKLHTSHSDGPLPVLHAFPSEQAEASSIATEIKRIIAYSGGMLSYSDFAILLRMNSLSRAIESALQVEGIPHTVLGGHRFFERMEVKDLVAYLQVVDNPQFVPAFIRAINIPSRAIGEKTVAEILARAEKLQLSPLEVVERVHDGKIPDIKPPIKRKVSSFVKTVQVLRKMAVEGANPGAIVNKLIELVEYQDHLKKHHDDWETRWDNVEELVNFASAFEHVTNVSVAGSPSVASSKNCPDPDAEDDWMDAIEDEDTVEDGMAAIQTDIETPLRAFLQASMLSTDVENGKDEPAQKDRVTIATCHAAKGLEWPVVFIPAVEKGVFPLSRAEDIEEERRLLYVACTRAQGLLYMSHCTSRMAAGMHKKSALSEFMSALSEDDTELLRPCIPDLTSNDRSVLATVLNRPNPTDEDLRRSIDGYRAQFKPVEWSFSTSDVKNRFSRPWSQYSRTGKCSSRESSPERMPIPNQPYAVFTSAKNSVPSAYLKKSPPYQITPLGPSRPGANAPRAPSVAAAPVKQQKARETTQAAISSYIKPRTARPSGAKHLTRPIQPDEAMPDVSVGGNGVYLSAAPKSRGSRPTANQNLAPVAPPTTSSSLMSRPKASMPVRSSLPAPSAPTPANKPAVRVSGSAQGTSIPPAADTKLAGSKRRLGMRGPLVGYTNKKFKPPTL